MLLIYFDMIICKLSLEVHLNIAWANYVFLWKCLFNSKTDQVPRKKTCMNPIQFSIFNGNFEFLLIGIK
jgi:hypothetical protein